jgi:hypothetical protein
VSRESCGAVKIKSEIEREERAARKVALPYA